MTNEKLSSALNMARRSLLAAQFVSEIGTSARLITANDGWPSIIGVRLSDGAETVIAAHLAPITSMARTGSIDLEERPSELRFQNPSSNRPPTEPFNTTAVLVGLLPSIQGDATALVLAGNPRIGNITRFSVRFPGSLAYEAARSGYAVHETGEGETFWGMSPRIFPAVFEMSHKGVELPAGLLQTAVMAAGPLTDEDDATKERARAAANRLVRSANFRNRVLAAYGQNCLICGLTMYSLLEAAHIYPVSLPESSDSTNNGIPACLHHHQLLDAHMLYVDPKTLRISVHPSLKESHVDNASSAFLRSARGYLEVPLHRVERVRNWLEKRYAAYLGKYDWVKFVM